jgi:hypothetical protein
VSDACFVKTRNAHQHELELTLHDNVWQSAVFMLDGICPGEGNVGKYVAVLVVAYECNFKRRAHIAIARLIELRIGLK